MEEEKALQEIKSVVDAAKTEIKSSTEIQIGKVQGDLTKQYTALEEQMKAKADAKTIADLTTQIKGAEDKYDELEKKYAAQGGDISAIATRLNEATLPGGSNAPRVKNMQSQINEMFLKAQEEGKLSELNNKSSRFVLDDGQFGIQQIATKAVAGMTNANLDGYANRQISQTVVRTPQNRTHIRELLNINTLNSAVLEYPQEISQEGAPGYQGAEGTTKPQVDYDLQMVLVKPVTIAAWMSVSKQALQDISWLAGYASRRMTEDLLTFEDQQLLYGNNSTNQLNGIITQATTYTRTDATYTTIFEFLVDAIAQQETLNYYVNGIVLHPRDYAQLLRYKTTTGEFDFPGLVFGGDNRNTLLFMGIPIYKNNRIDRLTALVGEWDYAELLVREGITFDISYEDSTNFRQNLVTLRIEERIALPVYRPAAFMKINLATILS